MNARALKALERAQQVAIDRSRRLHNAEVGRMEAAVIAKYIADIEAFKASK